MKTIDKELCSKAADIMAEWDKDLEALKKGDLRQYDYDKQVVAHTAAIEELKNQSKAKIFTTISDTTAGNAVMSEVLNKYVKVSVILLASGGILAIAALILLG